MASKLYERGTKEYKDGFVAGAGWFKSMVIKWLKTQPNVPRETVEFIKENM